MDGRTGQSADGVGEDRFAGADIDPHCGDGVRQRDSLSAFVDCNLGEIDDRVWRADSNRGELDEQLGVGQY